MVEVNEPLWLKSHVLGVEKEILNLEEYARVAVRSPALKRSGFMTEASRATGEVMNNNLAIVEMMMEMDRWINAFSGLVASCSLIEVISSGVHGSKDGTLLLMQADFQVISPMVPVRQTKFLRYCKQRPDSFWAVVDVSLDASQEGSSSYSLPTSVRLPSGCIIEDIGNGVCEGMLRPVISSGLGFGARRWLTNLQRSCECMNILKSRGSWPKDPRSLNVMRLSHRMVKCFYSGVVSCNANSNYNGTGSQKWEKLAVGNVREDVKILTRKSTNKPGEPSGVVLVASTSVWLPTMKERLFDYLFEDELTRKDWDILTNGGMMREMFWIAKGEDYGNGISLLGSVATNEVDGVHGGCILTFGLQIPANKLPAAKITMEAVDAVSNLLTCTIQRIKDALKLNT
ncbi:Homeobox-leucine zipper protein ROC5 [Linum perenne]